MNQKGIAPILVILIVVIGLLVIGGAGHYIVKNNNQGAEIPSAIKNPAATFPIDSVSPPIDGVAGSIDTSNWKTYRNATHGFELKYPPSWSVGVTDSSKVPSAERAWIEKGIENTVMIGEAFDPSGARIRTQLPEGIGIVIMENENPSKLSGAEYFAELPKPSEIIYTFYKTVDGIELYEEKTVPPSMPIIMFVRESDLYTISDGLLFLGGPSKVKGQFDAILSTLKFTE